MGNPQDCWIRSWTTDWLYGFKDFQPIHAYGLRRDAANEGRKDDLPHAGAGRAGYQGERAMKYEKTGWIRGDCSPIRDGRYEVKRLRNCYEPGKRFRYQYCRLDFIKGRWRYPARSKVNLGGMLGSLGWLDYWRGITEGKSS